MVRQTIILNRNAIAGFVDIPSCIDAIESAMAAFENGQDFLPPKMILDLPFVKDTALLAAITGYTAASGGLSVKVGQERSGNTARGLPTTASWINLFDPDSGELLMICDGTLPTMLRTAAAAAVSIRHMARADATTAAIIGIGQLGQQCARAAAAVRPFDTILVGDSNAEFAQTIAAQLNTELDATVEAVPIEKACRAADVIITATNSRTPIIAKEWVRPGTHLAGMGTDHHEKIEYQPELIHACRRIADMIEHALQRGEVSQSISNGTLSADTCFAGSLGQVITGQLAGRTSNDEITLYDGVGIGIQDTTIARTIYEQAVEKKAGMAIQFDA